MGVVLVAALAFFFYRRAIAFVFLSPLIIGFVWLRENERRRRRFEQMEKQFVDALTSLSGALKAGYSVENALEEVVKELEILYGPEVSITQEFRVICGKLDVNRRPEEALMEFADRSRLEDAAVFAEVFAVAVRSGGDLIAVIGRTTEMIGEKLRAQQEIRTAIRARQFEQKVMNAMPLGILLYMEVVSPGYLGPVYGNLPGVIVMSIGLLMYGGAFWLGKSMTEIEV